MRSLVVVRIVDEEMRAYYDRRAREYDDWWHGTGMFAQRDRPGWNEETIRLTEVLRSLPPARVLDDGSHHHVFKRFLSGVRLREELGDGEVLHEGEWFVVYRCAGKSSATA